MGAINNINVNGPIMYDELRKQQAYNNTEMSMSLEFISPMKTPVLKRKLKKYLREQFKLGWAFERGFKMHKIELPFKPLMEAMHVGMKAMHLIEAYGNTTDKCGTCISMRKSDDTSKPNVIRFMMNLDESFARDQWRRRYGEKMYNNSMTYVIPKNPFGKEINPAIFENLNHHDFRIPNSHYLGIDMSSIDEGVVRLRHVGGDNYHKKTKEFMKFVQESAVTFDDASVPRRFNDLEKSRLHKVSKYQSGLVGSLRKYSTFMEKHGRNIALYVDMSADPQRVKSKYDDIKEGLLKLMLFAGFKKGEVNYDTNRGRLQVRNVYISNAHVLEGIDLIECTVEGDARDCEFASCNIYSSTLADCRVSGLCEIRNSRLTECIMHGDPMVKYSMVSNREKIIQGKFTKCMLMGVVSSMSELDEQTEVITPPIDQR